jgi:hypothetical protein
MDETRLKNALQGKDGRSGGMNLPELIKYARDHGIEVKSSFKRQEVIDRIKSHVSAAATDKGRHQDEDKGRHQDEDKGRHQDADKQRQELITHIKKSATSVQASTAGEVIDVDIPGSMFEVLNGLPKLRREYGGIMDFKLDGSFEAMSMVPGEEAFVKSSDIPDYEVWWHNHPQTSGFSVPSLSDIFVLISRKHTQYSLIFTQDGTFVQWVPNSEQAMLKSKLFKSFSKSLEELIELFDNIIFRESGDTLLKQYVSAVRKYFNVETRFVPWGHPVTLSVKPYETSIHKGRKSPVIIKKKQRGGSRLR